MKRLFLILLVILIGCSTAPRRTSLPPTSTPEMLIIRPTRADPTPIPHNISVTMTVAALDRQYAVEAARMTDEAHTPGYHEPENIYSPTPRPCNIKGNVSSNGRYYHCPNFPQYSRTQIRPSEGDRWFCSVEQAIAAGFQAPSNSPVCIQ